jgi:hypothetical protein
VYVSPNIVRVIRRRMRWERHIAYMRAMRNVHKLLENLKGRVDLQDLGIDERIY